MERFFKPGEVARQWYNSGGQLIPFDWVPADKESVRDYWLERYGTDEGFNELWRKSSDIYAECHEIEAVFIGLCHYRRLGMDSEARKIEASIFDWEKERGLNALASILGSGWRNLPV